MLDESQTCCGTINEPVGETIMCPVCGEWYETEEIES